MERALVTKDSRVLVHTFAEGMFAKLAKDLEIEWPVASGNVTVDEQGARAEFFFDVDRVRVVGVVKGERTDPSALSESDREDIVKKLRAAIGARHGAEDRIVVVASTEPEKNLAMIEVRVPCGKTSLKRVIAIDRDGERSRVHGDLELSLDALGVAPVKGPIGAFRLSDRVRVIFDLMLT